MKKNNKGFTLVELLVTIVIMGIISGFSFPLIRGLQERNTYTKYEKYGESLVAAAKLYINSYEEDVFKYEDDLTECQRNEGQCEYILFRDLKEKNLIRDIGMDGISCNSVYTFVKVTRRKGKYTYNYFLGCGDEIKVADENVGLEDKDITFVIPAREDGSIAPYEAKKELCTIPDSIKCTEP